MNNVKEIKFRIWDKEENKMINGNDFTFDEYIPINYMFNDSNRFIFMQYIGLKDFDEVEIYEGDILEGENGYQGVVIFENGMFLVDTSYGIYFLNLERNIRVIGNKYENPELLEEE